jgi:hypothetical protein
MDEMPRSTWERKPIDRPERAARPRRVSPRSLRNWRIRWPTWADGGSPAAAAVAGGAVARARSGTTGDSVERTADLLVDDLVFDAT